MKHLFVVLFLAMQLAACTPSAAVVPTATLDMNAFGTRVTVTIYADMTAPALAIPTATFTPVPTAILTPSPIATPALDFTQTRIVSLGYNPSYDLLITLEIPNLHADTGVYFGWIEQYEYKCMRDVTYPERLFCYGHPLRPGTLWTFDLRPAGAETVLFTKKVTIPEPPIPGDLTKYWQSGCQVEVLYQPWWPPGVHPEFQNPARASCYAITCYSYDPNTGQTTWKCGTEDSCVSMPSEPCP